MKRLTDRQWQALRTLGLHTLPGMGWYRPDEYAFRSYVADPKPIVFGHLCTKGMAVRELRTVYFCARGIQWTEFQITQAGRQRLRAGRGA